MTLFKNTSLSIGVFTPVVQGARYINSHVVNIADYKSSKRALGGYYDMETSFFDSPSTLSAWLQQGLGRHIVVKSHRMKPVWEGLVNEITITLGAMEYKLGPYLDIVTKARVAYNPLDSSVQPPASGSRTSTAFTTNSTASTKYGVLEYIVSLPNATTANTALQVRTKVLAEKSKPPTSRNSSLSRTANLMVFLKCVGYWHTLGTYTYNNTAIVGDTSYRAKIIAVLGSNPNSGLYSADYSHIDDPSVTISAQETQDRTAMEILTEIVGLGDDTGTRYTMGFYNDRRLVYTARPTTFEYRQLITQTPNIRHAAYQYIDLMDINPGKWLYYPDLNIGTYPPNTFAKLSVDPRAGFVETVEYQAPNELSIDGVKIGTLDQFMAKIGLRPQGA